MNAEVNFHPTDDLLAKFVRDELSAGMIVVIAAHVEQCQVCTQKTRDFEQDASIEWMEDAAAEADTPEQSAFADMAAKITSLPQIKEFRQDDSVQHEIHVLDHSVRLPKVLAKIAAEGLVWKKMAGGINQASVALDDKTQCEFIYMKPGSQVPVHRHEGSEVTLVLDGSFRDDLGDYRPADFVVRDRSHTHQPASDEGCLCFAVLDSPLTFTQGLARLMNPFLKYRFWRATSAG